MIHCKTTYTLCFRETEKIHNNVFWSIHIFTSQILTKTVAWQSSNKKLMTNHGFEKASIIELLYSVSNRITLIILNIFSIFFYWKNIMHLTFLDNQKLMNQNRLNIQTQVCHFSIYILFAWCLKLIMLQITGLFISNGTLYLSKPLIKSIWFFHGFIFIQCSMHPVNWVNIFKEINPVINLWPIQTACKSTNVTR